MGVEPTYSRSAGGCITILLPRRSCQKQSLLPVFLLSIYQSSNFANVILAIHNLSLTNHDVLW